MSEWMNKSKKSRKKNLTPRASNFQDKLKLIEKVTNATSNNGASAR